MQTQRLALYALLGAFTAGACSEKGPHKKRVAVGVLWDAHEAEPCRLTSAQPKGSVKAERWPMAVSQGDHLVAQVLAEGKAVVTCEHDTYELELVLPAHIRVQLAETEDIKASEKPELLAVITLAGTDASGGPLEKGEGVRLRDVKWTVTGPLELVDGGIGKESAKVRVKGPGKGTIKAVWRQLSSEAAVDVLP